jgi:hypothetical protein
MPDDRVVAQLLHVAVTLDCEGDHVDYDRATIA